MECRDVMVTSAAVVLRQTMLGLCVRFDVVEIRDGRKHTHTQKHSNKYHNFSMCMNVCGAFCFCVKCVYVCVQNVLLCESLCLCVYVCVCVCA